MVYRALGAALVACALTAGCASMSRTELGRDVGQLVKTNSGTDPKWRRGTDPRLSETIGARLAAGVDATAAVDIALLANPDVQSSFERLGLARAEFLDASTISDPVVGWSRQTLRGGSGSKLEWTVLQSVSDLLALPVRRRAADRDLDRARLTAAHEILGTIASVRSAWLESLAAERVAAVALQREDLARLEAELMERFVKAGNEPETELHDKRLAYADQQRNRAAAQSARVQAREKLARLMGVSDHADAWELRGEFAALPESDGELTDLEKTALSHRLDLQAARKHAESRLAALGVARQKRIVPDLAAGYGRERDPDGSLTTGPRLELQLPLFSAAQLAMARGDAEANLAMRDAEAAALDVRGEVRMSRERLAQARAAFLLARDVSVPAAEALADLREREFFYMLIGPFAAMSARGEVMAAQIQRVEAERDYWLARIALAQAAALPLQDVREWAEPGATDEAGRQ